MLLMPTAACPSEVWLAMLSSALGRRNFFRFYTCLHVADKVRKKTDEIFVKIKAITIGCGTGLAGSAHSSASLGSDGNWPGCSASAVNRTGQRLDR